MLEAVCFSASMFLLLSCPQAVPKIVHVCDTAGVKHRFLVKNQDDLRQDAVIEQLFMLVDKVCCVLVFFLCFSYVLLVF